MMTAVKPVILATDALVFVLVAVGMLLAWYGRRSEFVRAPWVHVAHTRRGVVSAVILAMYVLIGVLDSMHFRAALPPQDGDAAVRYSAEIYSVLDVLTETIRTRTEKSFSRPFAAYALQAETLTDAQGRQFRTYPRLEFGGAHLGDPEREWSRDVVVRGLQGIAGAALAWSCLSIVLTVLLALGRGCTFSRAVRVIWHEVDGRPTRTLLLSLGGILLVVVPLTVLSLGYHVFGTDKVGQDVLYLALKSIRTGLVIGTVTTLVMLPFAMSLGIAAGYLGGWVDDAIQYLYTTLSSIPGVLLIAASVLMMQVYMDTHVDSFESVSSRADFRLLVLCVILGVTSWTGLCRLLRGEALKLRELEYIQAARAFGVNPVRIMLRHIGPNVLHIVIITTVLGFSGLVLAEAVLSYVGVGVDPAMNSFGTMINAARLELAREPVVWWSLAAAFVFMFTLVLSANLLADVIRESLDPRMRQILAPPRRRRVAVATRTSSAGRSA